MRTIVVCIDGTWNDPSQTDWDPRNQDVESVTETNVLRVFHFLTGSLHPNQSDLRETMTAPLSPRFTGDENIGTALYLRGVGTNRGFLAERFEGMTGVGTWDRIRRACRFLAEHSQPAIKFSDSDSVAGL